MKLTQPMSNLPVGNAAAPLEDGRITHGNLLGGLFGKDDVGFADLSHLAMEPGREEVKLVVIESESSPPLGNAALAQKNALLTASESFTDKGPLFESHGHTPIMPTPTPS